MTRLLIDLFYGLALVILSPFWLYRMVRHGRYRADWAQRLGAVPVRHHLQPVIWIHAVSLGEVNGIRTLVNELASQLPDYELVISSTTDTGMAAARQSFAPARRVFRFPLDFSCVVARAFGRLKPDLVVLMEGEIWPNFLGQANRRGVPVVVVNGRMSEDKGYPRYRRIRFLTRRMFSRLTLLAVQENLYADRFIELGTPPDRVRVTGTMKFDTAALSRHVMGQEALAAAMGLTPADRLVVAGGTGDGEEVVLLELWAALRHAGQLPAGARLAIVPRKPERFDEVARLIESHEFTPVRRSQRPDGQQGPPLDPAAVILGDTMGELRKFYALADAVFVGRSLVPMGGSDMIEAAALGKAVAFGPHVYNFPQAQRLVEAGVVRQVADVNGLGTALVEWLADPAAAAELGRRAQDVIRAEQGATLRNVQALCEVLGRAPAEKPGNIATRRMQTP